MMNDTEIWLERLNSLYRSQMRQAASLAGVQLVHFEILQYLSICNHYSNTAQAVSDYFGQTKGSISQSLKAMEKSGYIKRIPSPEDKRSMKIHLTEQGKACLQQVTENSQLHHRDDTDTIQAIKTILLNWQTSSKASGFGQCLSCSYHQSSGDGEVDKEFTCGLTKAPLSRLDIRKICREHTFQTVDI
ncbi:MAG: MarR family winged helix-turn-helix transcriptional regulator [Arenicella sp.]